MSNSSLALDTRFDLEIGLKVLKSSIGPTIKVIMNSVNVQPEAIFSHSWILVPNGLAIYGLLKLLATYMFAWIWARDIAWNTSSEVLVNVQSMTVRSSNKKGM